MAPKGKGADKGKNKDSGGAVKACQSISVRHILCEKHAKKELALAKLNDGIAFDVVAREYSEEKARTGRGRLLLQLRASSCTDGPPLTSHRRSLGLENQGRSAS